MRLIDADALLDHIPNPYERREVARWVDEQPAAPVREVKRGRWTAEESCPFCDFQPWYENDIHTLSFCPNCGADLREEE